MQFLPLLYDQKNLAGRRRSKKGYRRVNHSQSPSTTTQKKVNLAGEGVVPGRRRSWRMRIIPKPRLMRVALPPAPLTIWKKFKEAYMNMMLRVSGKVGSSLAGGDASFGGKRVPKARRVPQKYYDDEFESRLVYEIYKAMIASREMNWV